MLAETTLVRDVVAGDQVLETVSTNGFNVGDEIIIGKGTAKQERNTVAGFGSIILAKPLQFNHSSAARIVVSPKPNGCMLFDSEEGVDNTAIASVIKVVDTIDSFDECQVSAPGTHRLEMHQNNSKVGCVCSYACACACVRACVHACASVSVYVGKRTYV